MWSKGNESPPPPMSHGSFGCCVMCFPPVWLGILRSSILWLSIASMLAIYPVVRFAVFPHVVTVCLAAGFTSTFLGTGVLGPRPVYGGPFLCGFNSVT